MLIYSQKVKFIYFFKLFYKLGCFLSIFYGLVYEGKKHILISILFPQKKEGNMNQLIKWIQKYQNTKEDYLFEIIVKKVEKARIFKYDPTIQRHVYGAFDDVSNLTHGTHSLLAYNLNLKNKGIISFKFKVDEEMTTTLKCLLMEVYYMKKILLVI